MKTWGAFISLFIFLTFNLAAQHHDVNWIIRLFDSIEYRVNFDFTEHPVQITDDKKMPFATSKSSVSISDKEGNLEFYSNGLTVANRNHEIMENGDTINIGGHANAYYSSGSWFYNSYISLPFPANENKYYLIYNRYKKYAVEAQGLSYSVIDMNMDGGLGAVTEKDIPIIQDSLQTGGMSAVKHANGRDWWILMYNYNRKIMHRVLVSPDGIESKGVQYIEIDSYNHLNNYGLADCFHSVFTPDGSKYIRNAYISEPGTDPQKHFFYIFDFDRQTGLLSKKTKIYTSDRAESRLPTNGGGGYSVSPNSKYLYVSFGNEIIQYDITVPNIATSAKRIGEKIGLIYPELPFDDSFGNAQIAPDGRIYIANANPYRSYHLIKQPNGEGLNSYMEVGGIPTSGSTGYTVPRNPNYRLGPIEGSAADSLGIELEIFMWAHPYDERGCIDGAAYFEVTATGTDKIYQWQISEDGTDWENLSNNDIFSGADSAYLLLQNIPESFDEHQFRCVVSNHLNTEISRSAILEVEKYHPNAAFDFRQNRDSCIFTNQAQYAEFTWWDFGSGGSSIHKNPKYLFPDKGRFEVLHFAENGCGIDTVSQMIEIEPLKAIFKSDKTSGCAPLTVSFETDPAFRTTDVFWTFEGANPSKRYRRKDTVTYYTLGSYDVTLVVYNQKTRERTTLLLEDYITVLEGDNPEPVSILQTGTPDSIILSASSFDNELYTWQVNGRIVSDVSTLYLPPLAPGRYEIILESGNHCATFSDTLNYLIGFNADFSADTLSACPEEYIQFFNQSPSFVDSIQWYFQGGRPPFSSLENPKVKYSTEGTYPVRLTIFDGDDRDILTIPNYIEIFEEDICDPITSNKDILVENKISVFPNPAQNEVTVALNSKTINDCSVEFYNALGQLMIRQEMIGSEQVFDLSNWHSGLYFYTIQIEGVVSKSGKLIVEK